MTSVAASVGVTLKVLMKISNAEFQRRIYIKYLRNRSEQDGKKCRLAGLVPEHGFLWREIVTGSKPRIWQMCH